jgi:hypothetical protein
MDVNRKVIDSAVFLAESPVIRLSTAKVDLNSGDLRISAMEWLRFSLK